LAELVNRRGERLDFAFHPAGGNGRAVAVLAHGVTSNKDRPWLLELARELERRGIAALRFSFSGNGASEGGFEQATLAKEVEDLEDVLAALAGWRTAYVGHSMGAAVGALCAARGARLHALVSLAGMVHVRRFMRVHFAHLPFGAAMLGKPACRWNRALLDDAERIDSVLPLAGRVHVPWLLVHGTQDELVPHEESLELARALGPRSRLALIDGADHRFTGRLAELVESCVPWVHSQLCDGAGRR
jgi:pimeloyl-ACP methyl ester carboxylesterase